MRAQDAPVLSNVDENNFVVPLIIPTQEVSLYPLKQTRIDVGSLVIQRKVDTQTTKKLSEAELRDTIDFCANVFAPSEPEERQRVMELTAAGRLMMPTTGPSRMQ